jgi:hypothetical protein
VHPSDWDADSYVSSHPPQLPADQSGVARIAAEGASAQQPAPAGGSRGSSAGQPQASARIGDVTVTAVTAHKDPTGCVGVTGLRAPDVPLADGPADFDVVLQEQVSHDCGLQQC